jgi:hypothetical protein
MSFITAPLASTTAASLLREMNASCRAKFSTIRRRFSVACRSENSVRAKAVAMAYSLQPLNRKISKIDIAVTHTPRDKPSAEKSMQSA